MSWTFLTVLFVLLALACVGFLLLRTRARGVEKSRGGHTLLTPQPARPHSARTAARPQPAEPVRREAPKPSAPPPASRPAAPNYGYDLSRLVNLVYDEGRARRLVEAVQTKNPGMTHGWCVEKAIEQVLRDRHAG